MNAVFSFLLLCCLAVSTAAWRCTAGPSLRNARQIDAGQGKVVAVDSSYHPYFLVGSSWYRLTTTRFRHVSVGPAGLWGAEYYSRVYKWVGGAFKVAGGSLMSQVDAGGQGHVAGIYSNRAYCLRESYASAFRGVGSLGWSYTTSSLRYQSCSPRSGCWGVDTGYRAYYTQVVNSTSCAVTGRRIISGQSLKVIEVSTDGLVFGVSTSGRIYQRTGTNSSVPYGTAWTEVPLCITALHVSYDLGTLWVVTTTGTIMKCTQ